MTLKRSGFLHRKSRIKRSEKPMKKINPEKLRKRRSRKPKLKAWVRRAVLERDGFQCTHTVAMKTTHQDGTVETWIYRCPAIEDLQVHEKKYGTDDPDDSVTLCKAHHHALEWHLRPWNRNRLGRP